MIAITEKDSRSCLPTNGTTKRIEQKNPLDGAASRGKRSWKDALKPVKTNLLPPGINIEKYRYSS